MNILVSVRRTPGNIVHLNVYEIRESLILSLVNLTSISPGRVSATHSSGIPVFMSHTPGNIVHLNVYEIR